MHTTQGMLARTLPAVETDVVLAKRGTRTHAALAAQWTDSHTCIPLACLHRWLALAEQLHLDVVKDMCLELARRQPWANFKKHLARGSLGADMKLLSSDLSIQLIKVLSNNPCVACRCRCACPAVQRQKGNGCGSCERSLQCKTCKRLYLV